MVVATSMAIAMSLPCLMSYSVTVGVIGVVYGVSEVQGVPRCITAMSVLVTIRSTVPTVKAGARRRLPVMAT
jgi:hypothetical protein